MQLNEGLEELGAEITIDGVTYAGGVFGESTIENIKLPSTLKRIEAGMFQGC